MIKTKSRSSLRARRSANQSRKGDWIEREPPISQTSSDEPKSLEAQQIKPIQNQQPSPSTVMSLDDKETTRAREEKRRGKQIMMSCTKPCGPVLSNAFSALGSLEEEG